MPVGYWWTVAVISWGVACALTRWRRLGPFSAIPALVVNEMPFIVGYLLIASTVFALFEGDLDSPGGVAGAAVALLALAGLVVVVRRALRAHATVTSPRAATCHPCSWCTARTTCGYRRQQCAPSWNGHARHRAARSSMPSYQVHTTTSTCTSPSGQPP